MIRPHRDNYLDRLAAQIRAEVPAAAIPDDADTDHLFRAYAVLLDAVGGAVTARDVHNAWVAWMLNRGRPHPACVPYDELPPEVAQLDDVFVAAIRKVAQSGGNTPVAISTANTPATT